MGRKSCVYQVIHKGKADKEDGNEPETPRCMMRKEAFVHCRYQVAAEGEKTAHTRKEKADEEVVDRRAF